MRSGTLGAGVLLVWLGSALAAAAAAVPESEWVHVGASDAFYEAWLPVPPDPVDESHMTPVGSTHSTGFSLDREADGCEIRVNELPAAVRWLGGESWTYQGARRNLLEDTHAREVSFGECSRNGVEGRALEWENAEAFGRAELYVLPGRLYLFTCYARRSASRALLDGFFQRLRLHAP